VNENNKNEIATPEKMPNIAEQLKIRCTNIAGWWFEPIPLKNDGVRQLGSP
jgi:hypothetical protein